MNTRSRRVSAFLLLASAGGAALGSGLAIAQEYPQSAVQWAAAPLAYTPGVLAAPGWVTGAGIGSLFGAMAGGLDPRPVLLGGLIGGLIGHAESYRPSVPVIAAPAWRGAHPAWAPATSPSATAAAAPAAPSDAAASAWFFEHWHRFAAPRGNGAAADSGASSFIERWQQFAEPYRK
jgi:hypothetical protein